MNRGMVSFIAVIIFTAALFAQSGSVIQFWDTTGTQETGKFGWEGDESGKFVIESPDGGSVSVEGSTVKAGSVEAKSLSGDGSGITGVAKEEHGHGVGDIEGLEDSLAKKMDAGHEFAVEEISGLGEILDGKSDTGHTHSADEVLGTNSVQREHIADGAVTGEKISENTITEQNLNNSLLSKINEKNTIARYSENTDTKQSFLIPGNSSHQVRYSRSISTPAAGLLIAFVSTQVNRNSAWDGEEHAGKEVWFTTGLVLNSDLSNIITYGGFALPDPSSKLLSFTRAFQVPAGTHSVGLSFLNASESNISFNSVTLTLIFIEN